MFRTAKAMMVAGMIAAGLPLLTRAADAQVVGQWYLIEPMSCYMTIGVINSDGEATVTSRSFR